MYTSVFVNSRKKPSQWPSASSGDPTAYGIRPEGAYSVNVDKDTLTSLKISSVEDLAPYKDRYMLASIMSSASPGGLWSKKLRKYAQGEYISIPASMENIDIAFGKLGRAIYGIGVPVKSQATITPINLLLLTKKQLELMNKSEFVADNYYLGSYTLTTLGTSCKALAYIGKDAVFYHNNRPLTIRAVPSRRRAYPSATVAQYLTIIQKEFNQSSKYFKQLRYLYETDPEKEHKIIANINNELKNRKILRRDALASPKVTDIEAFKLLSIL